MNSPQTLGVALLALLAAVAGCTASRSPGTPEDPAPGADGKLEVFVVNYPLAYFAERIGGDRVRVGFPVEADVDPAFWAPDAEDVAAFQNADLILLNGAGYARWIARSTLPSSRLVDTSRDFRDRYIVEDDAVTHAHGPQGDHSHGEVAFTTWLDPELAIEHARATLEALSQARPEHEAAFEQGFAALERDLRQLDERLSRLVGPRSPLLASHPVYQYLARRYELDMESVHFEPDEVPAAEGWDQLRALLERHPARLMLWEAAPVESSVATLRELGVDSVVFDPAGNAPAEGDWLSTMLANVSNLEGALAGDTQAAAATR